MKILMATSDYDDRILALLEFKKLNVAHSIDFVSTGYELEEYLYSKINHREEVPNLLLINSNIIDKDGVNLLMKIKLNSKWSRLEVVVFSSFSNLREIIMWKEGARPESRTTNPDELTWILREICDGLAGKDGWQYQIKPSVMRDASCVMR